MDFGFSGVNDFDGYWLSGTNNQRIKCKAVDMVLKCSWSNGYVEEFAMSSECLKGLKNPTILGYPSKDGIISWNTGNQWTKEGNCLKLNFAYILVCIFEIKYLK